MPYNNTPIAPPKAASGQSNLPLARVKKILAVDEDINSCSNNAAFVITIAAEMFIQHLVEQTHQVVKTERKQRRNIQYRDVANAVARIDNLEFLSDVVPKTTTVKKVRDAASKKAPKAAAATRNGQMKFNHTGKVSREEVVQDDTQDEDVEMDEADDIQQDEDAQKLAEYEADVDVDDDHRGAAVDYTATEEEADVDDDYRGAAVDYTAAEEEVFGTPVEKNSGRGTRKRTSGK